MNEKLELFIRKYHESSIKVDEGNLYLFKSIFEFDRSLKYVELDIKERIFGILEQSSNKTMSNFQERKFDEMKFYEDFISSHIHEDWISRFPDEFDKVKIKPTSSSTLPYFFMSRIKELDETFHHCKRIYKITLYNDDLICTKSERGGDKLNSKEIEKWKVIPFNTFYGYLFLYYIYQSIKDLKDRMKKEDCEVPKDPSSISFRTKYYDGDKELERVELSVLRLCDNVFFHKESRTYYFCDLSLNVMSVFQDGSCLDIARKKAIIMKEVAERKGYEYELIFKDKDSSYYKRKDGMDIFVFRNGKEEEFFIRHIK